MKQLLATAPMLARAVQLALLCFIASVAPVALAAEWPAKPITLLVTFGAGSGSDINARFYAIALKDTLNAVAVVDFRPGAAGLIGGNAAAKAAPDGYTVLVGSGTVNAANYPLYKGRMAYSAQQFATVATLGMSPAVMFVPPDARGTTVMEVLKEAQGRDGKVSCGTGNTVTQVACEMLGKRTRISVVSVPYKGTAQALIDVAAGRLSFAFADMSAGAPLLANGRIRAVGVPAASRLAALPEVKTFAEQGIPDFEFLSWTALFVPAKTPPDVVRKLNSAALHMLSTPEYQAFQQRTGGVAASGNLKDSEQFVANEIVKWERYVRESGVQGESP